MMKWAVMYLGCQALIRASKVSSFNYEDTLVNKSLYFKCVLKNKKETKYLYFVTRHNKTWLDSAHIMMTTYKITLKYDLEWI